MDSWLQMHACIIKIYCTLLHSNLIIQFCSLKPRFVWFFWGLPAIILWKSSQSLYIQKLSSENLATVYKNTYFLRKSISQLLGSVHRAETVCSAGSNLRESPWFWLVFWCIRSIIIIKRMYTSLFFYMHLQDSKLSVMLL